MAARTTCLTCAGPVVRTVRSNGSLAPAARYCSAGCKPRCAVANCGQPVRKTGLCAAHYSQKRVTGAATPFTFKWADRSMPCVVCGAPCREPGRRKHCSGNCQVLDSRHHGARPTEAACAQCGCRIDLLALTPGRKRRRATTKLCSTCKRSCHSGRLMSVQALAARDGTNCGVCRGHVDLALAFPDPWSPSVDHVVARANGGDNEPGNLQLAHLTCNHRKQDFENFDLQAVG